MKLLAIIFMIFGISQCRSTKLVTSAPFSITKATVKKWVGGLPGNSGMIVSISITSKKNIEFDSIYFQGRITKLETNKSKGVTNIIGKYYTSTKDDNNLILHIDPKEEFQNKIPKTVKFPFELKQNQAVISYKEGKKINYFKIENIQEIASDFHPKAPPRSHN